MPESRFSWGLEGIAGALAARRIAVPIYQRSYSWGSEESSDRDHVQEFWSDLHGTFVESDAEYFLGTVVLSQEGTQGRATIIDGQQRLATTAILIAAIRDTLKERGDQKRADIVHSSFLAKADLESADDVPQLTLNADDDAFFRELIVMGNAAVLPTRESHLLIRNAYNTLKERIAATADDAAGRWAERLIDWVKFVENRARVIVVEVPTEADAFLIFETLNDRGADLTIADLLKNYLFGHAAERLESVRSAWTGSLANLDISAAGSQLFTDFLRHYWSSRYGATRERELYARIKERIGSSATAVEFTDDLQAASRIYSAILHPDHELWTTFSPGVRENVRILASLGLEQNRPLLLAAIQHLAPDELTKVLRALVSWSIRGLVIGGIGGGTTERIYCDAAMKIRSGASKTLEEIRDSVQTIIRSDAEFQESFRTVRVTRSTLARYMLVALERTALAKPEPELVPNQDETQVNLEHILPRNPAAADWGTFTDDERRTHLHRLGNMCLLSKGPNDKIGNRPFAVKKPILEASQLELTRHAGAAADWTPEAIGLRQDELAQLALSTWPI